MHKCVGGNEQKMIAQLGNSIRNREQLIEEGFTQVAIDGEKSFSQKEIETRIEILCRFNPGIEYKTILVGENYEIYNRRIE